AERLPQFRVLWPAARLEPAIAAPAAAAETNCGREEALVEILRGRLEGLGPVTREALAAPLGLAEHDVAAALAALEAEGFAMRGRFTPAAVGEEWCERRLLARIHRYTIKRLRAEIEPVAARDFLRFLLRWQRVDADARMAGPDAVDAIVGQLEGFEAPAGAWESEILVSRGLLTVATAVGAAPEQKSEVTLPCDPRKLYMVERPIDRQEPRTGSS